MAVDIVFEAHSLTTDNEAGVATGWLDGQLSEHGRVLATELGRRRRHDGMAAVFTSDLGRAVETVELAFGGSGVPVHLDVRLREVDYGAWNGMSVSRLEGERTRRIRRPFPGGESYQQVVDRVAGAAGRPHRDPVGPGPAAGRRRSRRAGDGALRLARRLVLCLACGLAATRPGGQLRRSVGVRRSSGRSVPGA